MATPVRVQKRGSIPYVVIPSDLSISSLEISGLTASRLIASDASNNLESTDISDWIDGVDDDGDGTGTVNFDESEMFTLMGSLL